MPQWNFRTIGPIATDFCWRVEPPIFVEKMSCQAAGGCGKGQTFRHILPTVTLVVLASQNCNALICFHLLKVVFLQFLGLFTPIYLKKSHMMRVDQLFIPWFKWKISQTNGQRPSEVFACPSRTCLALSWWSEWMDTNDKICPGRINEEAVFLGPLSN